MLLNRAIPLVRTIINQSCSKHLLALNLRMIATTSLRHKKNLTPEEEIIKFSQSKIHPNKLGLQQSKVLSGTPEGDKILQKRKRVVLVFFMLPTFFLAVYFLYFSEMEIDLEQENRIEKVIPGYQKRRMADDPRYKEKMLELNPELRSL